MVRSLLIRGMLVGLLAGLAAFGFARWKGEPNVNRAIAFESYVEYDVHHEAAEPEMVSRALQDSAGLGTGAILYGVAMGGIFALLFTVAYGRIGLRTARGTAALLGFLGFVGVYLVPLLKYPANPPSVGQPDTIGKRTVLYLVMLLLSIGAIVAAVAVRRRIVPRFGEWNATLLAAGGYIVAMAICYLALPGHQRGTAAGSQWRRQRRHRCRRHVPADGAVELPDRVARHPAGDVDHHRARVRRRRRAPARTGPARSYGSVDRSPIGGLSVISRAASRC